MSARLIMKLRVADARVHGEVLMLAFVHLLRPELPAWTPGAHVDLRLPDGKVRQYSLCGQPGDRSRYEIAVKREDAGRGGSAWVHANLRPGVVAHVSAPRNNFPIVAGATRHVFVAGGIGITPIAAMAEHLAAAGTPFDLHDCARSRAAAPLLDRLERACGPRLYLWLSSEGRRFSPRTIGPYEMGAHLYACGPARLVTAIQREATDLGWPPSHIHIEAFQTALDDHFKPEPFRIRLASSGRTLHVPADRSILEVLREHGIALPSSCELGLCGSCVCEYREGTVIHRDSVLTADARQDHLATCVSRARVVVTLDL